MPSVRTQTRIFIWPLSLPLCDHVNCLVALLLVSNSLWNSVRLRARPQHRLRYPEPPERINREMIGSLFLELSLSSLTLLWRQKPRSVWKLFPPTSLSRPHPGCCAVYPPFPSFSSKHETGVKWCTHADGPHDVHISAFTPDQSPVPGLSNPEWL